MNDLMSGLSATLRMENILNHSGSLHARHLGERIRSEETLNTQIVFVFLSVLQLLQGQGFAGVFNIQSSDAIRYSPYDEENRQTLSLRWSNNALDRDKPEEELLASNVAGGALAFGHGRWRARPERRK